MSDQIVELTEDLSGSPLYSDDLAPVPADRRTWGLWNMSAIWIGMAVNIPTYVLASYMIRSGLGWVEALTIIFLANVIVTVPMIFNGHAGVKYGIPFPVLGRASFGISGVHIPALVRALVACGWFGIQIWIGGLAIYAIWTAATGAEFEAGLTLGKFVGFGIFWLINLYFIWNGTESIRRLEDLSAPILIFMGLALIGWGASEAGGFGNVLRQSEQLRNPTVEVMQSESGKFLLHLNPLVDLEGNLKAEAYRVALPGEVDGPQSQSPWLPMTPESGPVELLAILGLSAGSDLPEGSTVAVTFRNAAGDVSSAVRVTVSSAAEEPTSRWSTYLFWLTAMVGFWATMAISIADITRYVANQRDQVAGQFIGLPGTMLLYSFVGVFVTSAALIHFDDILIGEDAPWDPVSLIAKFDAPVVVIIAQFFMLIATLSTNIAANVIAPANAFANAFPKQISFRGGGIVTGVIGILMVPWWLLDEISNILLFVSGLLGPVLAIFLADYFTVKRQNLSLADLYKPDGVYSYRSGFNMAAIWALLAGVVVSLIGYWVPALQWLYTLSWFTGFAISYAVYVLLMRPGAAGPAPEAA